MPIERGLSIRQPFAWAVCANVKRFENRTWTTDYRGTIAIHASTSQQNVNELLKYDEDGILRKDYFEFGAIIGLADIVDVQSYGPQHESDSSASGPYCWEMTNGRFLNKPIPFKGKLNLFKVPDEIQKKIEAVGSKSVDFDADKIAAHAAELMDGDPDPILSYQELVAEWSQTGNHLDAVKVAASRLVELDPKNPFSYNVRGLVLWTPESADERLQDFRKSIELDDQFEPAWDNLVAALQSLDRLDEMYKASEDYVSHFPESARAFEQRARAFYCLKRFDEALKDCDKAINLDPVPGIRWALRAEVKREFGDKAGARKDIDEAIRLEPESEHWSAISNTIGTD